MPKPAWMVTASIRFPDGVKFHDSIQERLMEEEALERAVFHCNVERRNFLDVTFDVSGESADAVREAGRATVESLLGKLGVDGTVTCERATLYDEEKLTPEDATDRLAWLFSPDLPPPPSATIIPFPGPDDRET